MKKHVLGILLAGAVSGALMTGCGAGSSVSASSPSQTAAQTSDASAAQSSDASAALPADTEEAAGNQDTQKEPDETAPQAPDLTGHTLMIYCGAGMTKPFQEIAESFKSATGCEMNVTYANAGQIQSQITASEEGDMFIAGSAEELKPVESYVSDTKALVKHIPVLAVQSGNPKNISSLTDLTNEGVTLIIGEVDSTPIGKIAQKALTDAGIFDQVQIEASTTTAPQMATAIGAGEADAAIIWKENCDAEGVEIVENSGLENYIKTIPAASLSSCADDDARKTFLDYLNSGDARQIWMKYGYEIAE